MTTEMEWRVTEAIEEIWTGDRDDPPAPLDMAKAAIKAMREPTQDMINAAELKDDHTTSYAQAADALTHWQAMIDAASPE